MVNDVVINKVRAFVSEDGKYGNPTGIVVDTQQELSKDDRQKIATSLHYTETVFINNLDPVSLSFFNPQQETKFAGDALISTSYFIRNVLGKNADLVTCKVGKVRTWEEGGLTWIESSLDGTPPWNHKQLESPELVDSISPEQAATFEHTMVWAWMDKEKGLIRSRTFLLDWGALEDQGNGSGSMQLAKMLGQRIEIHQGMGSVIYAKYAAGGDIARVGGRVKKDDVLVY